MSVTLCAPLIELRQVRVRLGDNEVFSALDLRLEPGAFVALIGPPGTGKSVLLKLLAGLIQPTGGELVMNCREGGGVGMVFQNNALFDSKTIFENVAFPLHRSGCDPARIADRVRARLCDVELPAAAPLYPHQLSGGMQKRAGIARAVAHDPQLRLYDEPTAGLDPVTASRILNLIARLHAADPSGVSIVVSNEMDGLLQVAPRTVMLLSGGIVFDGATDQIHAGSAPRAVQQFVSGDVSMDL